MQSLHSRIKSNALKQLLQHWGSLCGEGPLPSHAAIDPLEMFEALPNIWIYRLDPDGDFTCTLAGSEIDQAWKDGITNRPAKDFLGDAYETRIKRRWHFMLREPAALFIPEMQATETKICERLVLPLVGPDGNPYGVLGATHYSYPSPGSYDLPVSPVSNHADFYKLPGFELMDLEPGF